MNTERKWSKLDERPTHSGYYWALSYRKRGGILGIVRISLNDQGVLICQWFDHGEGCGMRRLSEMDGFFWCWVEQWPIRLPPKDEDPAPWTFEREYGPTNTNEFFRPSES